MLGKFIFWAKLNGPNCKSAKETKAPVSSRRRAGAAGKRERARLPPLSARPWSLVAADETPPGPAPGGRCRRPAAPRRTSAAASSSSPPHPPPPSAPSAPSPTPTRGNSRRRVVPARGRVPTRAGSAGAARRSSGLRSTTRCSSTRASALPVTGLGCSAA